MLHVSVHASRIDNFVIGSIWQKKKGEQVFRFWAYSESNLAN